MGSRVTGKNGKSIDTVEEVMKPLIEYALELVLVVLCIVVPLYAKDGYNGIGDAKFAVYRAILLRGFSVLLVMAGIYAAFHIREIARWRVSITDYFVLAYLVLTLVSIISGGFYDTALWGYAGWNMGFMAQFSFVLLYFFLSRFGKQYRSVLASLCTAAFGVFLLGILHRLQIDPFGFYDGLEDYQKAQFLSTLGQATWYASFLIVVLPVGIAFYLYAKSNRMQVVSGIFTWIGFCTLVTQNSDSAYFAAAGFMLVFMWDAVKKRERLLRYLSVMVMFLAAGKAMYFLMQLNPNPALKYDFVTDLVLSSAFTWVLLALCVAAYGVLFFYGKGKAYPLRQILWVRNGIYIMAGLMVVVVVLLIYLNAKGLLPEAIAGKISAASYMNWGNDWGNGRGKAWMFGAKVFMEASPVNKLFGVGPDCFSSYTAANYPEEVRLLWGGLTLTNVHNEWFNIIINAGLLGGAAYIGIFVSAFLRFVKRRGKNLLLTGIAASIISYIAYNFFCYQQVLCTPFIFMLMGIGEYFVREQGDKEIQIAVDKTGFPA